MMKLIYTTAVLFFASLIQAQTVKVIDTFDELEAYAFDRTNTDSTYVINFWATWCAPCIKELPYFEELNEASNLEVTLVSIDFANQYEKRLLPFVKKKGLKSRVLHLADPKPNDWIDRVDPSWSGAIPATLLRYNGHQLFLEQEFTSYEELQGVIQGFIRDIKAQN